MSWKEPDKVRIFPSPKPTPTAADLRREFTEAHAEEFLPRAIVAAGICYSLSWLELAATRGGGPPYYKRGRRVLYRKAEVLAWMEENSQRVRSTSEYPPKPSSAAGDAACRGLGARATQRELPSEQMLSPSTDLQ